MKRCPQCGREYDSSMMFCLDDGAELLYGPASMDEPATAVIPSPRITSEGPTRSFRSGDIPIGTIPSLPQTHARSKSKLYAGVAAAAVLFLIVGFFGYRYFSSASAGQIESIAVMPFVNESGNADVEYLSDGMTETLIKSLSNLPNLNVKPRSSVFRYKGKDTDLKTIGSELNVQAILNGRVAQRGDQLTLSLELVDVRNDKVIWTEQYKRKASDLVSLQGEIAKDVSANIKAKLSGAEEEKVTKTGTADPQAYQAYLKGRYYWNRRTAINLKKALEEFSIATDRDPNYALAFVGLADCYALMGEYAGAPTAEVLPKAKAYAERALTLDSTLGEVHATLALIADYSWQWTESEKEYKLAIEANPSYPTTYHWYSINLKNLGRFDEANAMIRRAQELDPVSSVISINVTRMLQLQGNDEAAIQQTLKLIELDPNFPAAYQYIALSYIRQGRKAEAIAAGEKGVELSNRSGVSLGDLGYVYALGGRKDDALHIIAELESKRARGEAKPLFIAVVYAGLNDKDKMFEWLEKGLEERSGQLAEIRWQMPFEPFRNEPRFKALLKGMNLPE
jgi:TolB-like protein/Flp pilus assembly protein TadD